MSLTRISAHAKQRLERLAEQTGATQKDIIDAAIRVYERELFLDQLNEGYAALRSNEAAWADIQAEQRILDGTIADGLNDA